jgi:peptide-methionine (R)-S-oxide reductase
MHHHTTSRRAFLLWMGAPAACVLTGCARAAEDLGSSSPGEVLIENFSAAGASLGKEKVPRIVRTDAEWRRMLSAESFQVTRKAGTERPYSGQYNAHGGDGLYRCICCATALFDSRTKFESGTGWPSFWKPISQANVVESIDRALGMVRISVTCSMTVRIPPACATA